MNPMPVQCPVQCPVLKNAKNEITTRIDHSETYIKNEYLLMTHTKDQLSDKIKKQAKDIYHLKTMVPIEDSDPLNNADATVVVSGLPIYPQENPILIALDLIDNMGTDHNTVSIRQQVKVIKAARLPSRYSSKPPLMKINFQSLAEKKRVLSHKRNVQSTLCNSVYIRSSKSHEVRLIELNARTILQNSTLGNDFRINGNGQIIPKQGVPQQTFNKQFDKSFPTTSHSPNLNGSLMPESSDHHILITDPDKPNTATSSNDSRNPHVGPYQRNLHQLLRNIPSPFQYVSGISMVGQKVIAT